MNFIAWLVIGGLIGWVASMIMKTDAQQGIILNVVVGIVGAFLGGWLLGPYFHAGTINQNDFSLPSLAVSLLGAITVPPLNSPVIVSDCGSVPPGSV